MVKMNHENPVVLSNFLFSLLASFLASKSLISPCFSPLLFLLLLCSMSTIPCRKFHYGYSSFLSSDGPQPARALTLI